MTPNRIYTNKNGTAIITPPAIPLHPTDIEWVPAAEVERLQAALDTARDDALEEAANFVGSHVYTTNGGELSMEPVSPKLRGMDRHHATIATAIRAMKGKP